MKVPGMLSARSVRPAVVGATLKSIDKSSIIDISGVLALADPSSGQLATCSNDVNWYRIRNGVAKFVKVPREKVHVVWMQGPQAYGRTAANAYRSLRQEYWRR
jgi:hypothetical protein